MEGDMGAVWVKLRPILSLLAVRVKAKLLESQSCLEVMVLKLPGCFRSAPVIRTHVLVDPIGRWGLPITSGREEGAIGLCQSSIGSILLVTGRSYSAFDMRRRSKQAIYMF